jgi:hypothetical protein
VTTVSITGEQFDNDGVAEFLDVDEHASWRPPLLNAADELEGGLFNNQCPHV